jgi:hypothetical protein
MAVLGTDDVICPRCTEIFGCGARTGGCWCAEVTLDDAVRADFAHFYDGCLCPDCLREVEDARPAQPSVREFLVRQLKRKWGRARA